MTIFARYVLRQLAAPTALALIAFAGAVWLSQSLRFVDLIVNKGLSVGRFLYLTSLLVPSLVLVVLPFAAFVGTLIGYHRLRADSELASFRATGLSDLQIARGAFMLGLIFVGMGYVVALYVMPLAYRHFRDLQFEARQGISTVLLQERVFTELADGLTVYVEQRLDTGDLANVIVHDSRQRGREVTLIADEGRIATIDEGPVMLVKDGSYQERDDEGTLSIVVFDETAVELEAQQTPGSRALKTREMSLGELLDPPPDISDADRRQWIAEAHERLSWPLVSLALPLVAATCVLRYRPVRDSGWRAVSASAVIAIAVVVLSLLSLSFAKADLAVIPVLYLVPLLASLACLWLLAGGRMPTPAARPSS